MGNDRRRVRHSALDPYLYISPFKFKLGDVLSIRKSISSFSSF